MPPTTTMKTSLLIEDSLFREAKKEAEKQRRTLSEVISEWARLGRDVLKKARLKKGPGRLRSVDLGGSASVDLNSRRDWMDLLE